MNTKQLLNDWRSFLNESESSESSSNEVNVELKGTKLSVYHLSGVDKISRNSVKDKLESEPMQYQQNISSSNHDSESRARKIVDKLKKGGRKRSLVDKKSTLSTEFDAVRGVLGDPFTKGTGFRPGSGAMYGKALYACYKFNPEIAHVYGNLCLKFEVDISNFIIFFEDLAKQIHGDDWRIEDQVRKVLKARGYDFDAEVDNITKISLRILINDIIRYSQSCTESIIGKSYLNDSDLTSGLALRFTKVAKKVNMPLLFDGIIFRGGRDGPVCVSYDPENDAKLTKLGRINKSGSDVSVFWSDNLSDFFGDLAKYTYDIDFQTMNDIADENHVEDSSKRINYVFDEKLHVLESFTETIRRSRYDTSDFYAEEKVQRAVLDGFGYLNKGPIYNLETTSAKRFIETFIETFAIINIIEPSVKSVFVKLLNIDKYKNNINFCKKLASNSYEPSIKYDTWSYTHAPVENEVQMKLAQHPSSLVRKELLNNSDLSRKVLEFLADDKDEEIARMAGTKLKILNI